MSKMVEVMIDSVRVSLTSQQRIVLLRCLDEERYLPIWIGPYEAEAITIALQEIEVARPQTHDLLIKALAQMNARLARVEVVSMKEDVFYGNLVIEKDGETFNIDARPSDSFALAVRAHVPILMASEILDTAGVSPSPDLQQEPAEPAASGDEPTEQEEPVETKKRLSVYEDFLQNLDLDDQNNPDENEPEQDPPIPPEKP